MPDSYFRGRPERSPPDSYLEIVLSDVSNPTKKNFTPQNLLLAHIFYVQCTLPMPALHAEISVRDLCAVIISGGFSHPVTYSHE